MRKHWIRITPVQDHTGPGGMRTKYVWLLIPISHHRRKTGFNVNHAVQSSLLDFFWSENQAIPKQCWLSLFFDFDFHFHTTNTVLRKPQLGFVIYVAYFMYFWEFYYISNYCNFLLLCNLLVRGCIAYILTYWSNYFDAKIRHIHSASAPNVSRIHLAPHRVLTILWLYSSAVLYIPVLFITTNMYFSNRLIFFTHLPKLSPIWWSSVCSLNLFQFSLFFYFVL